MLWTTSTHVSLRRSHRVTTVAGHDSTSHAARRGIAAVAFAVALLLACATRPAGLELIITTDLKAPDDYDTLQLHVSQEGTSAHDDIPFMDPNFPNQGRPWCRGRRRFKCRKTEWRSSRWSWEESASASRAERERPVTRSRMRGRGSASLSSWISQRCLRSRRGRCRAGARVQGAAPRATTAVTALLRRRQARRSTTTQDRAESVPADRQQEADPVARETAAPARPGERTLGPRILRVPIPHWMYLPTPFRVHPRTQR